MIWIISKIVNAMQYAYVGWNYIWWSYHMTLARFHVSHNFWHSYWFGYHISRGRVADYRISKLDADWRKNLEEN